MAHTVEWFLYPRIAHVTVSGDLTVEDIANLSHDLTTFLDEGQTPVHFIIDDAKVGRPPIHLNKIQENAKFLHHPMLGWQVGVGDVNPLMNYIVPMVMKVVGVNLVRRKTAREALEFLNQQDFTLKLDDLSKLPGGKSA